MFFLFECGRECAPQLLLGSRLSRAPSPPPAFFRDNAIVIMLFHIQREERK